MEETVKHDDLIYDVGMHRGEDTDFYLKKGFRVIGFEANPALVELNNRKFANDIENQQLVIVSGAIVENPSIETVTFYLNDKQSLWGTVDPAWASRNEKFGTRHQEIEVASIDFAKCLQKYGIPYYMKIDIEGADLVCLKSLSKCTEKPSYVSMESEKISFESLNSEIKLLESLGYDAFLAVQQANISRTKMPNPAREGKNIPYKFMEGASGLFGKDHDRRYKPKEELLKDYEKIFSYYKRFGDDTLWYRHRVIRRLMLSVTRILNKPLPGWYDTHARHSSVI